MSDKGERELIDWIRGQKRSCASGLVNIGIGDDLAGLRIGDEQLLYGCDQVLDGVHFRLNECGAKAAGRKALARNLSDVAAMAAVPVGAVASVALPENMATKQVQEIVGGMDELAEEFNCPVIGGDVGSWRGALAISVSVLAKGAGLEPVKRSGAKEGDAIMVTGELGGSILGKHLVFGPMVKEARALAEQIKLHAMIDVSDGLAVDLHHITIESKCGAEIWAEKIPVSAAAKQLGDDPLRHSLTDGEDYELLFTLSEEDVSKAQSCLCSLGVKVSHIGRIIKKGVVLIDENGNQRELSAGGFEHFKGCG